MNFKEKIWILDGAMGTMLQKDAPAEGWGVPVNDMLNVFRPDAVEAVHRAYIDAGADIIETNTFNATSISLSPYGAQQWGYQINMVGAQIARSAADWEEHPEDDGNGGILRVRKPRERKVWVAGSMGPTAKSLSMSPKADNPAFRETDFDAMAQAYSIQAEGLITGGADFLLVETVFDGLNLKAALYGIGKAVLKMRNEGKPIGEIPVMVSLTLTGKGGRTLTGQTVESMFRAVKGCCSLLSFGLNCSFGAEEMIGELRELKSLPCPVSVYPNAGLPDVNGEYDETPEFFAGCMRRMAEEGLVNIAGGCCGTTPEHIRAAAQAIKDFKPREIPENKENILYVSGLDTVMVDREKANFINVGERANVNGSKKFAKCIEAHDYAAAAAIARAEVEDGAAIIDINTDDAMIDGAAEMQTYVRTIESDPEIARVPLMIDSSDWKTLVTGLKNAPGKSIANSISLRDGEEEFIRKATELKNLGAAAVVMAFDENGQAVTYERKIEICSRAYDILTQKVGFEPEDIIFDPNILPVGTGVADQAAVGIDYIKAVGWIKKNLRGARTSGGVSNLSFAFRGNNKVREAMHSVFLYHAIREGLDMAIVNPAMLPPYDELDPELRKAAEDVVLDSDPEAADRLGAMAVRISAEANATPVEGSRQQPSWRDAEPAERLSQALVKGDGSYLEQDLKEVLELSGSPLKVVEGPLMDGMGRVGKLFADGKMFLPQVIRSARIMKEATTILQPAMEAERNTSESDRRMPVMVIATAKGDVHDIGKNICDIVLKCNNIDVRDLGVMVENGAIVSAAREYGADYIAISGLVTPSLKHFEELCRLMEAEGMKQPLFVGGAAASALHTAVRLAPLYSGAVVYTADASKFAAEVNSFTADPLSSAARWEEQNRKVREIYLEKQARDEASSAFVTMEEARKRAPRYSPESFEQPKGFGDSNLRAPNIGLENLIPLIDWQMLLAFWGFKGKYPEVIYSNPEAEKCFEYAQSTLAEMHADGSARADIFCRFFDARSENEDIILSTPSGKVSLTMPRATSVRSRYLCLADFIPSVESGMHSAVGLFTVKVEDLKKPAGPEEEKSYEHLMRSALCARLAEAGAGWLQQAVAPEGTNIIRPAFGYACSPDHSMKKTALGLIDPDGELGIRLTESYAMIPETSVCGMLIAHPSAQYFTLEKESL
jgi:5-methyltetrahydrofolate--homocysteine methyltransferase